MKKLNMLAAGAMMFVLSTSLVHAKLPVVPMDAAAKAAAEAKKAKAAEAKKHAAEALAKAEDRAVANYKKNHGMSGMPAKTKK